MVVDSVVIDWCCCCRCCCCCFGRIDIFLDRVWVFVRNGVDGCESLGR